MNCSKYKEIVYRIIDEKKNHPTAEMVFDDLKPNWPKLSLATVYRNLRQLVEENRLREISVSGGGSHFDATMTAHCHTVCSQCGEVCDVALPMDETLAGACREQNDFQASSCDVVVYGTCSRCRCSLN